MKAREKKELLRLERRDGSLRPESVVEFAKNPKTALHRRFTWDDTKAAHEHRLWQARQVIRVWVVEIPNSKDVTRAFVSLQTDRNSGAGYRSIVSVVNSEERYAELLRMAVAEARVFQLKFRQLKELAGVFGAIDDLGELLDGGEGAAA